jgi:hypothetical protein
MKRLKVSADMLRTIWGILSKSIFIAPKMATSMLFREFLDLKELKLR